MWYDLLTLCILMFAMFRGAMKGIVWQLATIASLTLCFFFSGSLSPIVAPFIRVEPPLDHWIAMFVLYLGFSFVSYGFARVLHEWIERIKIEALDRHLGAILGLVKGSVFCLFLTFFLVTLSRSARESIINSESGYAAAVIIDHLDPVLPGHLHAMLEPYLERLDAPGIERRHADERYTGHEDRPDRRDRIDRERRDDPFRGDPPDARSPQEESREIATDRRRDLRRDKVDPDRDRAAPFDRDRRNLDSRQPSERRPDSDPFDGSDPDADLSRRDSRRYDERSSRAPVPDPRNDDSVSDAGSGDWLSSLPAAIGEDLRELARKAWRNTRPEHRAELKRRVASNVPELIRKTLHEWENGRPAATAAPDDDRAQLERDIVHELAGDTSEGDKALDDIQYALHGIPDDVAVDVLRDWRADLRSEKVDPDPQTTTRMGLNERIRRQLAKAGISIRSLDTATQDRLRQSDLR